MKPHLVVKFRAYNGDTNKMETVCQAYLVDGRIVYEGEWAKQVEEMVYENGYLKPWRERGGWPLFARLCLAFNGSYFSATEPRAEF